MATDSIIKLIVKKDASVQAGIKDLKEIQKLVDDINRKGIQLSKAKGTETAKLTSQITTQTKELQKQIKIKKKNADLTDEELRDKVRIQEIDRARTREIRKQVKQQEGLTKKTNTWGNALGSHMFKFNALGNIAANIVSRISAGFSRMLRMGLDIFMDFETTMSRVKAITGATDEEFLKLEADAKRLGESTEKTASQVGQLQVEYAKLGFTTQEILNATEATLNLSTATGSDLAQAAQVAGATIRGFGLNASETQRVTDVMTASFNSSALDLDKFSTAMSKVAPVAKAFGFSLEDSTALLAKLSDAGFDASTAATSTRNILLNLADTNGKLAKALGKPVKSLPELVKGLKELDARGVDLAETLELTDKRSVAAFQTFLNGADDLETFSDALKDSAGEAQRTADIMRDNLQGDTDKAKSAIQGLVITLGEKLAPTLRKVVQGFTAFLGWLQKNSKMLKTIGKVIVTVIAFLVGYKIALLAINVAKKDFIGITKKAIKAIKLFSSAMKVSPIGLFIGLLTAAAAAFFLFRKRTDEATEAQNKLNKAQKLYNELMGNNKTIKERIDILNTLNKIQTENLLQNIKDQIILTKELNSELLIEGKSRLINSKEIIKIDKEIAEVRKNYYKTEDLLIKENLKIKLVSLESIRTNTIKNLAEDLLIKEKKSKEELKNLENYEILVNKKLESFTEKIIKSNEKKIDNFVKKWKETIDEEEDLIVIPIKIKPPPKDETSEIISQWMEDVAESVDEEIKKWEPEFEDYLAKFLGFENREQFDKAKENVFEFTEMIISEWEKALREKEKILEKETKAQEKALDRQEQRAMMGQENTLAFEKEALAKKEAERVKQEKKAERQAKLKAWYNIVANSENMQEAFKKLAMMEVAAAMFREGGIVEDNLPKDGIFKGKSHKQGGIPIVVEGKEGIFSGNEMANLGKDNFYNLKNILGDGKIDSNLFEKQNALIPFAKIINPDGSSKIVAKLEALEKTIKSKREYNINWDNEGNRIEEIKENNRTIINKYINSRPRI